MASLYTHKSQNITKTWILFSVFFVVVMGIGWVFSQLYGDPSILVIAVIFSSGMSIVSYWYSDKIVLKMTNAKPVDMRSAPELYRIVENLSITAGLPMPIVYIVPERAPNAFATGRNPEHAVVAVTAGLLERLDRSELEGVLAHELSHIGNHDILISTVAVVLVGFVSILANMFLRSMLWGGGSRRRSSDDGGNAQIIFFLVGIVFSILAPIGVTIIQLAISRKREFLADASGALLTRYPEGLACALEKISSDSTPMAHAANTTTAHMWVADPYKEGKKTPLIHKLFMTHPPVEERLAALRDMRV
ncbi:MAG: M48 family metallopeptidase [bacterium]